MKLTVKRNRLVITPEDECEEAYIEEVLGLKEEGDTIALCRRNAMGLSAEDLQRDCLLELARCVAYLETIRTEET